MYFEVKYVFWSQIFIILCVFFYYFMVVAWIYFNPDFVLDFPKMFLKLFSNQIELLQLRLRERERIDSLIWLP